jgi:hypothetical protein
MAVYSEEYLKDHPEIIVKFEKAIKYCSSHCHPGAHLECPSFSLNPECGGDCYSDHV